MAGRPIDEKIVVMKLDNSDFKQKASETVGLFGKLRDGLNKIPGVNLGKTVQDLNGIQNAAGKANLNPLAASIQGVSTQFSAMSVIATTALATIVNRAVNAGTSLAKALSMDQVTAGFQEYELKMGSIQTILANTSKHGTTLKDVTRNFEELNAYADKTIYNFGDMTKNIGLFTNAGLKLDESTSMIKGFSNMAAASGTNSERAAGAAYQLSQGLSSGYIMTMDWMSLTNAGMGNDNMKNDLIALGQEMGTLDRTADDTLKNWKESLSDDKWLTTDVMSTYLQTMAGDIGKAELLTMGLSEAQADLMLNNAKMGEDAATKVRTFTQLMDTLKESIGSGWATSFEHILGDFNEATELFSSISDKLGATVGKSNEARNKFIKEVADGNGFKNIFEGLVNLATPIGQMFRLIKSAWQSVFPPASVATVIKLTESFKKFTEGLALAPKQITQFSNIFRGLFSLFSTVWEIVKRLGAAFVSLIPEGAGGSVLDLIEKVALMSTSFNRSVKQGNGLTRFISGIGKVLSGFGNLLGDIGGGVVNFAGSLKENLGEAIGWITDKLAPVGAYLKETFGGSYEALGAGTLLAILAIIKKIQDMLGGDEGGIFDSLKDMVDGVAETFGGIGDAVNEFATSVKYVNLILIATAIGILAVSLKTLEGIKAEDLAKGIGSLAAMLGVMIAGMMVMSKFNVTGGLKVAVTLIALAAAVSIMASALKKISDLDTDELIRGISGLAAIVATLSIALIAISKFGGKLSVGSLQLLALAGAVVILASAIETMSAIETGSLFKAVGALALIFGSLAIFLKIVDRTKFGIGSALGVVAIAAAVKIMVSAISDIALLDVNTLVKGLTTITLILAAVALFSKVAGGPQMLLAGAGLLLIAGAINALMGPVTTLAGMTWEELAKGMAGMAASLLILAGAAYLMTGGIVGALGVIAMAAALQMLIGPIERFAAMTWGEMLKGFAGVAIGLTLMAGAALLLTPAVPSMLAFGAAVALIGLAMMAAGVGFSLFAGGLVTLASMTAASVGAIVAALSLLITGLGTIIIQIVEFVVKLGSALLDGLALLIPKLVDVGWKIIMAIVDGLETNLPILQEKGAKLLISLIDGMAEYMPQMVDSIANLVTELANAVESNSGTFLNAWLDIMTEVALIMVKSGAAVIEALFGWIPGVGDVAKSIGDAAETNIVEAFNAQKVATDKGSEFAGGLSGTSGAASAAGATVGAAGATGASQANLNPIGSKHGSLFATGLLSGTGASMTAGTSLANASESGSSTANLNPIGSGHGADFAGGILGKTGAAMTAGTNLGNSAKGGAGQANLNPVGSTHGSAFASGVTSKVGAARTAGTSMANGAKTGAGTVKADTVGSNFGSGFAGGIMGKLGAVRAAAGALASAAAAKMKGILDIRSPSRVTKALGGHAGQGFANGVAAKKKAAEEAAKKVAEAAAKAFAKSKEYISDRKYYNEYGLAEELEAWEKVQKKYKKGTEERKEADKEVYRLKNEINKKLIALNDEYTEKVRQTNQKLLDDERALNDEYKQAVADKTKSLAGFVGLFDSVEKDSKVSGAKLLENLRGQVTTFTDWKNDLQALGKKKIYSGLLAELTEMGPKAADEIAALNTMTNEQLQEYSNLWGEKNQLAKNEAERELKPLKDSTVKQINELRKAAGKELTVYKNEWLAKMKEIRYGTPKEFVGLNTSMKTIGHDAIDGMIKGMKNMSSPLAKQAKALADSVAKTIKSTLKIKSPSRITMGLGQYVGEGLAKGMANQASNVGKSAKDLAVTAKDSINKFLEGFDPAPEDNEIHFKAVVDYDGFRPGIGKIPIGMIPDTSRTSGLVTSVKSRYRQNGDINPVETAGGTSVNNEYNYDIHVTANGSMSRTDVRKLAIQIRDEIKNEDDRGRISRGKEVIY